MSKNGSITAFFRPVPKPASQTLTQPSQPRVRTPTPSPSPRAPASPVPPSPPSPPLPYLFSSPPAPVSSARDRNAVIKASDDEDDDDMISSDDDLPMLFRPSITSTVVPMAPARRGPVCVTPRAKRTAREFHSSPLTINSKHKFDFKALLKHAAADNALEESKQRIESMQAREDAAKAAAVALGAPTVATHAAKPPINLHDTMLDVLSDVENSQDEGARKRLLRAVKRTTETAEHRKCWHFFDDQVQANAGSPSIKARPPFPKLAATGLWSFLAPDQGRSELFEDRIPYNVQSKTKSLPDDIFIWVLRNVLVEDSRKLRHGYFRLLSVCPDQVRRIVDGDHIDRLFRMAGASQRAFESPSQATEQELGQVEYYAGKDWSTLRSLLQVLIDTSASQNLGSLERSVSILLRLGMDNIIREHQAVARDYQDAIDWLVAAVPEDSWDNFCGNVCVSLYNHITETSLRCDAASSIPLLRPRLVDLRRRLALVCIFEDPQRGYVPPEMTFNLRAVIDLLGADKFKIDRHHADFHEVAALAELLGYAVGDGCPPPDSKKQFNDEVDELARKIKVMWTNIQRQGASSASRLDARLKLQNLERKLEHATRTRPPQMPNIFGITEEQEEVDRPRQQLFMRNFLQGKKKSTEAS